MRRQSFVFAWVLMAMTLFATAPVFAETLTVGNDTVTPGNTVSISITIDTGDNTLGAFFTVIYDTANLTLDSISSSFFDTYVNQNITPTSVEVDGTTYSQPIYGLEEAGKCTIAGTRTENGPAGAQTLFVLNFSIPSGATSGVYPISITSTVLHNTEAGYDSGGEAIPMLIGFNDNGTVSDLSDDTYPSVIPEPLVTSGTISIDGDNDGDGVPDLWELATFGDLTSADATTDYDNDGILDINDNASLIANPDQTDTDGDGIGDVIDPDDDNDSVLDVNDNCSLVANPDQSDSDGNGIGDACDVFIAYYAFEGNADDQSGNDYHGTEIGSVTYNDIAFGQIVSFDGSSHIELSNANQMLDDVYQGWSTAFLVAPSTLGTDMVLLSDYMSTTEDDLYGLSIKLAADGTVIFVLRETVSGSYVDYQVFSTTKLTAQNWYHIVATAAPDGKIGMYINGTLEGEVDFNFAQYYFEATPIRIATNIVQDSYDAYFTGWLDELKIYNHSLSGTEVSAIFNQIPQEYFQDQDGDTVTDTFDNCPDEGNPLQYDLDGDGIGLMCDPIGPDQDNDGIEDVDDNCPNDANPLQKDYDGDGIGIMCDPVGPDQDNDGIEDADDNCPIDANPLQKDYDGDGIGIMCDPIGPDQDNDGVEDADDNCPNDANPLQKDYDGDGIGIMCDPVGPDQDNDGIEDVDDNCPNDANPLQYDLDGDGTGLVCDTDTISDQDQIDQKLSLEEDAMITRARQIIFEESAISTRARQIIFEESAMSTRTRQIFFEESAMATRIKYIGWEKDAMNDL